MKTIETVKKTLKENIMKDFFKKVTQNDIIYYLQCTLCALVIMLVSFGVFLLATQQPAVLITIIVLIVLTLIIDNLGIISRK